MSWQEPVVNERGVLILTLKRCLSTAICSSKDILSHNTIKHIRVPCNRASNKPWLAAVHEIRDIEALGLQGQCFNIFDSLSETIRSEPSTRRLIIKSWYHCSNCCQQILSKNQQFDWIYECRTRWIIGGLQSSLYVFDHVSRCTFVNQWCVLFGVIVCLFFRTAIQIHKFSGLVRGSIWKSRNDGEEPNAIIVCGGSVREKPQQLSSGTCVSSLLFDCSPSLPIPGSFFFQHPTKTLLYLGRLAWTSFCFSYMCSKVVTYHQASAAVRIP
jgi:hypothetical protein